MEKTIYQSPNAKILAFWHNQDILAVSEEFVLEDFENEGDLF